MRKCIYSTAVFIKNDPRIGGPMQFKPMLFRVSFSVCTDHAWDREQALNKRRLLLSWAVCELLQASLPFNSAHETQYKAWPMTGVYYSELNYRDKTFADFLPDSIWEFKCISHSLSLTINLFRRKNMYAFLQTVTGIKSIVYSYPANGTHRTSLFSPLQSTSALPRSHCHGWGADHVHLENASYTGILLEP